MSLYCRDCLEELDLLGKKEHYYVFECPKCEKREFYTTLKIDFPFSEADYVRRDPYPLGGVISKDINKT